jgi:hypothetical protein
VQQEQNCVISVHIVWPKARASHPAICCNILRAAVLSAVSGLQVKAGLSSNAVIGITCAILVALFAIQSWGTQRVGVLFAPTIALWLLSNVLVGIYNICMFEGGSIFRALSPHYIGGQDTALHQGLVGSTIGGPCTHQMSASTKSSIPRKFFVPEYFAGGPKGLQHFGFLL